MSEKGGKMFSLPQKKSAKSSLKSSGGKDAPLKGKDDTPARAKMKRKVQFDAGVADTNTNFSSKSAGKDAPTFPRAGGGVAGKGDKTSNGGKTSATRTPDPLELRIGDDLPENTKCLMACEAAEILQGIQDLMTFLSKDPSIKNPISFDRGLQYAKQCSNYTNSKSVRQLLGTLTKHGVTEGEICAIADVCPETADEVFALVPSLKAKKGVLTEPLKKVLDDLAKLKKPASNPKI